MKKEDYLLLTILQSTLQHATWKFHFGIDRFHILFMECRIADNNVEEQLNFNHKFYLTVAAVALCNSFFV